MKMSYKKNNGMPSIRIPVAPPVKVMASLRDYDRKRARKDMVKLLVESE
jgi:hypothetical protein